MVSLRMVHHLPVGLRSCPCREQASWEHGATKPSSYPTGSLQPIGSHRARVAQIDKPRLPPVHKDCGKRTTGILGGGADVASRGNLRFIPSVLTISSSFATSLPHNDIPHRVQTSPPQRSDSDSPRMRLHQCGSGPPERYLVDTYMPRRSNRSSTAVSSFRRALQAVVIRRPLLIPLGYCFRGQPLPRLRVLNGTRRATYGLVRVAIHSTTARHWSDCKSPSAIIKECIQPHPPGVAGGPIGDTRMWDEYEMGARRRTAWR